MFSASLGSCILYLICCNFGAQVTTDGFKVQPIADGKEIWILKLREVKHRGGGEAGLGTNGGGSGEGGSQGSDCR